jgi:spermidine/putrescine transport system substrate-binding protein
MKFRDFFIFIFFLSQPIFSARVVNVYVWGGEIPKTSLQKFEQQTGIKVNFSTYDSNETMYAKLRASRKNVYDVILPSGYYVERMRNQGLLTQLDPKKLPNLHNLDSLFFENDYDRGNQFSVPLTWGATGIFYNSRWVKTPITFWKQLWEAQWKQKLLLLDDAREIFSMTLLTLGFDPNDGDPQHVQEAYQKLLQLTPNIKLFASDSIQALLIDEDATIGTVWNGDAYKAHAENPNIKFVYPQEGFVIWVDCLAIPENPPHPQEAYEFINFMLKPESAVEIALLEGHAITNAKGKEILPPNIRDNALIYPSVETLKRGYFQRDVGDETVALFNQYWEQLKLAL